MIDETCGIDVQLGLGAVIVRELEECRLLELLYRPNLFFVMPVLELSYTNGQIDVRLEAFNLLAISNAKILNC